MVSISRRRTQLQSVKIIYPISILAAAVFFSILVFTILVVIAPETFPAKETFGVFPIVVVPVVVVFQEKVIVVVFQEEVIHPRTAHGPF